MSELRLKVATVWRGEWSADVAYNVLDEVSFSAEAEGVKRGNYRSLLAANREPLGNENAWVLVLDLEKTQSATEEAEEMNKAFANAESKRVEAENKRVIAENSRVEAENKRVTAENSRVEAESKRVTAESGRADAETNRRTAEEVRISNEQARESAENSRVDAESKRASNEQARESAENNRVDAESKRVSNEQARESAENSRAVAEANRANEFIIAQIERIEAFNAAEVGRANAFTVAQQERAEAFAEAEAGRDAMIAGKVEDITRLQGEVAKKANIDGYYSSMAVGAAESLMGQNVTTQQFTFQPTGNTLDVQDGLAVVRSIKGNTVVANKIFKPNRVLDGYDNKYKVVEGRRNFALNHKFLIKFNYSNSNPDLTSIIYGLSDYGTVWGGTVEAKISVGDNLQLKSIVTNRNASNSTLFIRERYNSTPLTGFSVDVDSVQIVSLTKMFGAGNEPTVEEFERLYPNLPTEYNEGSLLNLNAEAIKSVGFNAFNGEYAKVLGGMQYYLGGNITSLAFKENLEDEGEVIEIPSDNLYTPNTNGYLVATGSDICINLSHSGYRNGEYEPYKESIVNLPIKKYFPDGMKSAGEVRDEIVWDESIKKYKAIQRIDTRAYQTGDEDLANVITDKVNTYYELETPKETIIDDYDGINYEVSDFGTEEIIANNPTTPIIIEVVYGVNAVDTLRRLPQTYISTDSMIDFLAQLGSAMNGNWTMVYNDVNSKWTFTFTANEVVNNEE